MFYLIEISTGDSKVTGRAVYAYDNEHDAVANYHGKLSTAMKSDLYDTELVMVVDETGKVIKRERYTKAVPVPDTTESIGE